MAFRWMPPKKIKKKKSGNAQKVLDKLKEYLESSKATGEPIQILCGFWKDQQTVITYQELRQAVIDGAISNETIRLWQQDYSILVANQLSQMWTNAFEAGAAKQSLLEGLDFKFDMQTPGITKWINERGAGFVTASTNEQKNAIAALLTKKIRDNHSVDELARMIRPCIGLTEGQAKANVRYYDSIVANLRKEHPRMKPESVRKKARDAAAKYAERQHRQRAMMIAQTESAFAYNRGADEGVRQAQSQNLLGIVRKCWSTSGDDAVCSICSALEGVEIDMDADFDFKGKVLFPEHHMLPPAHPRCACAIEYIEVEPPVVTATETETFEVPTEGNTQDYKEVVLDDNTETYKKGDTNITAREVLSSSNHIYVSEAVKTKRKQIHQIDTGLSKALKKMDIANADNLPTFLVVSAAEMRSGVLASYNAYKNIMYINEYAGSRKTLLASQESFAESDNDISTYIHELIHWLDAEFYRMKHHGMIDKKYEKWINKQCKKKIEKLVKSGYNINEISEYACYSLLKGKFDEVYTEYRVSQTLGR